MRCFLDGASGRWTHLTPRTRATGKCEIKVAEPLGPNTSPVPPLLGPTPRPCPHYFNVVDDRFLSSAKWCEIKVVFCKVLGRGTTNIEIGDKGRRLSEVAKTVAATFISHSPESDIDGPPVKAVTKSV